MLNSLSIRLYFAQEFVDLSREQNKPAYFGLKHFDRFELNQNKTVWLNMYLKQQRVITYDSKLWKYMHTSYNFTSLNILPQYRETVTSRRSFMLNMQLTV